MPVEWLNFGDRYGWIALAVTYAIFKISPLVVEKIWPRWMAAQRAEKARIAKAAAEEVSTVQSVYEKFIKLLSETIQFVAGATDSIREMSRSIDYNTHQLARLTHAIEDLRR